MFESAVPDLADLDLPSDRREESAVPGGAALVAFLEALAPAVLSSDAEVLDLVAAWDRVATWALARSVAAAAEFARRPAGTRLGEPGSARAPLGSVVRSHADDELAVRLGSSRRAVAWRLNAAVDLATRLPATARAFSSGRLDSTKVRVVVEECAGVTDAGPVEDRVVDERAFAQPPARLRERVRRAVIAADPAAAAEQAERARASRRVVLTPQPDGMSEVWATLPAPDAAAIQQAVDAAARSLRDRPGETRDMDQLRADCLVAPFWNALRTGYLDGLTPTRLTGRGGQQVAVGVTVPAAVLLGLSEQPGELAGYGPIPAPMARELAREGRWRRLLTDEAGALVHVGRRAYRPTAAVQRLVEQRDVRCRFPGCSAPAARCDLDHVVPFPQGDSSPENLIALCRRHHLFKHGGRGDQGPGPEPRTDRADAAGDGAGGAIVWRLPDGRRARSEPPAIGDPAADEKFPPSWRPGGQRGDPPGAARQPP